MVLFGAASNDSHIPLCASLEAAQARVFVLGQWRQAA